MFDPPTVADSGPRVLENSQEGTKWWKGYKFQRVRCFLKANSYDCSKGFVENVLFHLNRVLVFKKPSEKPYLSRNKFRNFGEK